jgi:putative membrane protein
LLPSRAVNPEPREFIVPTSPYIPYCGSPPVPADLLGNWNLDPALLLILGAAAACYAAGAGAARISAGRQAAFYAGWAVLTLALVSPLCNLTVALFSARVAQHMIIVLLAAPLLVLGHPERACRWMLPASWRRVPAARGPLQSPALGAITFGVLLWLWHAPYFYDATLQSHAAYWAMHVSLIGSSLLLWQALLQPPVENGLVSLTIALSTMVQMGFLGALLTFAPGSWYVSHRITTWPWGLTALEDQQLGGLIMWVPGGGAFLIAALVITARLLLRLEARRAA